MPTNGERLARLQAVFGKETIGVYLGVYTDSWRAPDFVERVIKPWQSLGGNRPDYAFVKVGEYGTEWYDGTFPAIRASFMEAGFGCCPYYFCRPTTAAADAQICADAAKEAGCICLDIEEQWDNDPQGLVDFIALVRHLAGAGPVILVSAYGDPLVGTPGWNAAALAAADGVQPQFYLGWWQVYHDRGVIAALGWGDGQWYQEFVRTGLGADYPIQPALNVENISYHDLEAASSWCYDHFHCSVTYWVQSDMTPATYGAVADARRHVTPNPTPGPTLNYYTVVAGDTLSTIAARFNVPGGWANLYAANRTVIGNNPNLIFPGQVLHLP